VFSFYDVVYNAAFIGGAALAAAVLPANGYSAAALGAMAAVYLAAAGGLRGGESIRTGSRLTSTPCRAGAHCC
jgi:hypothetical protein